jgi:uncharacterized protein (TIGR02611 family)
MRRREMLMKNLLVVAKCIAGGALIVVGIVLIPLPGPGTPLIVAGLAVLGTEFEWAARLSERIADLVRALWRRVSPV